MGKLLLSINCEREKSAVMKWGYIALNCLAFWAQGLFWGWESSLYLACLGVLLGYMTLKNVPIQFPKIESAIIWLMLIGYGLSLVINPTNSNVIALINVFSVFIFILIGSSVLNNISDVLQWYYIFLLNVCALLVFGWLIRSDGQLGSVFDYANLVAALCMMAIIFTFPQLFSRNRKKRWKLITLYVFLLISLVATGARITWGITLVCLFSQTVFLFGKDSIHIVKRICYGSVVALVFLAVSIRIFMVGLWTDLTQTSSLRIRLTYDWDALRIALDHPWVGVGAEGWNKLQYQYQTALYSVRHIHNHFLQLWLEGGILALIAWVAFIWIMIRDYALIRKYSDKSLPINMYSIWLATVAVVLYSALDFILSFPALFCTVLFYLLVRRILWKPNGGQLDQMIPRGVVFFLSLVMIVGGILTGYRELLVMNGESALANGEIRTVLKYEELPAWSISTKDRDLLLGKAFFEKAKRTEDPKDWQKSLYYLGEGIKVDPTDPRFYPPYVNGSLQLKNYQQAAKYASQLVLLQPRVINNYELYAETLNLANDHEKVLQLPNRLAEEKDKVYQEALFKRNIPALKLTNRLEQIIKESSSY